MKNIFFILMLLPTLLLANTTSQNCQKLPATIKCENWILNGETQKNNDWECLVEEKVCRNLNGCGKLVGTYIEKRLSGSCSIVQAPPEPSVTASNKCSRCLYSANAKNYQQVCATWNEAAEKWESAVVASCTR